MRRFASTLVCDVRLQFRNGFYYAAGFVVFCWILALSQIPGGNLGLLLPAFIFSNLLINT